MHLEKREKSILLLIGLAATTLLAGGALFDNRASFIVGLLLAANAIVTAAIDFRGKTVARVSAVIPNSGCAEVILPSIAMGDRIHVYCEKSHRCLRGQIRIIDLSDGAAKSLITLTPKSFFARGRNVVTPLRIKVTEKIGRNGVKVSFMLKTPESVSVQISVRR
jgi:hypothetical protein